MFPFGSRCSGAVFQTLRNEEVQHDKNAKKTEKGAGVKRSVLRAAGGLVGGDAAVKMPFPPCGKVCPHRSLGCHNEDVCEKWKQHQIDLRQYNEQKKKQKRAETDFREARGMSLAEENRIRGGRRH